MSIRVTPGCPRGSLLAFCVAALLTATAALEPRDPDEEEPPDVASLVLRVRIAITGKRLPHELVEVGGRNVTEKAADWKAVYPRPNTQEAVQIMIGLIHSALGHFWIVLYLEQVHAFSSKYRPIVLLSGFPFWSFLFYVISGSFAVRAEKERSLFTVKRTLEWTMNSFTVALFGVFIIIFEIASFLLRTVEIQWPQLSGMMLSTYLWIFCIVEIVLANVVVKWLNEAFDQNMSDSTHNPQVRGSGESPLDAYERTKIIMTSVQDENV